MPNSKEFRPIASDAFKSWSRCRRQFFYKFVKRLDWPSDAQHFRLGRDVHKLLDYQARGLDCGLLLAQSPNDVRWSFQKLMAHPIAQLPVLGNEWGFHLPVAGQWVVGRIDRIARDEDRVLVIDWKTGTGVPRQPESDWQTVLYLYALVESVQTPACSEMRLAGLQPEQVSFVYVEVKPDESTPVRLVEIPYDRQKHAQAGALIVQTVQAMRQEEEYPLPGRCPDRFCVYRPVCGIEG